MSPIPVCNFFLIQIVQHKWQDQKNQLHVTSTLAFVFVNVQQCPLAMLAERKHEGEFFVKKLSRDKSIHYTGHVVHPLLNPAAGQSFAADFNVKSDSLCSGCTQCERNHTLVRPVPFTARANVASSILRQHDTLGATAIMSHTRTLHV